MGSLTQPSPATEERDSNWLPILLGVALVIVVVGIADANDLKSWVYDEDSGRDADYIFSTDVVISAREADDVGILASSKQWEETDADEKVRVWTDDYSNILGALYRRLRYGERQTD